MKKVSIITIHIGTNVGSNLQAIATCRILESLGLDTTLVNYIPPRVTDHRYWSVALSSPVKFLWRIVNYPSYKYNQKTFDHYLRSYIKLSPPIFENESFVDRCPSADYYITGSDQVWNTTWNEGIDTHYFFAGIKGNKIAFASSIGSTSLTDEEVNAFKTFLPDYSAISVREKSSQILLDSLGFNVEHILDPTLLLDSEQWSGYMRYTKKVRFPYVLVYLPYNVVDKEAVYSAARFLSKKHKLKIVTFSWNYFSESLADITIKRANPGEFLYLMAHAKFVITNSFHGTAFSINLKKHFWVFMPSKFSSRISSLLDICGLQNRMIKEDVNLNELESMIDYDHVDSVLESERVKAQEFLQRAFA